jgi:hypothetical protein
VKALQAAPINRLITFSGSMGHAVDCDQLETEAHIQGELIMDICCTECGYPIWINMTDKSIKYLGLTEAVYCDACLND